VSFYLNAAADIENAVALLKQSFDLALAQRWRRATVNQAAD